MNQKILALVITIWYIFLLTTNRTILLTQDRFMIIIKVYNFKHVLLNLEDK